MFSNLSIYNGQFPQRNAPAENHGSCIQSTYPVQDDQSLVYNYLQCHASYERALYGDAMLGGRKETETFVID